MSVDFNSLLDANVNSEFTSRPPLPVGDYVGIIGEFKENAFRSGDRKDGSGKWYSLSIPVAIDLSQYPGVKAEVNADTVVVFHSVFLDMVNGKLDDTPGKNKGLGEYRKALGQQAPPWNPRMMQGRPIRVKIKHRTYEGRIQEDVDGVAAV